MGVPASKQSHDEYVELLKFVEASDANAESLSVDRAPGLSGAELGRQGKSLVWLEDGEEVPFEPTERSAVPWLEESVRQLDRDDAGEGEDAEGDGTPEESKDGGLVWL